MKPSITSHPSILCVSNDASLLESRRLLLQSAGYTVLTMTAGDISASWNLPSCDLVMICQSVGEAERSTLLAKLRERGDLPYILMDFQFGQLDVHPPLPVAVASHQPEALLRCVRDMLQQCKGTQLPQTT